MNWALMFHNLTDGHNNRADGFVKTKLRPFQKSARNGSRKLLKAQHGTLSKRAFQKFQYLERH